MITAFLIFCFIESIFLMLIGIKMVQWMIDEVSNLKIGTKPWKED